MRRPDVHVGEKLAAKVQRRKAFDLLPREPQAPEQPSMRLIVHVDARERPLFLEPFEDILDPRRQRILRRVGGLDRGTGDGIGGDLLEELLVDTRRLFFCSACGNVGGAVLIRYCSDPLVSGLPSVRSKRRPFASDASSASELLFAVLLTPLPPMTKLKLAAAIWA